MFFTLQQTNGEKFAVIYGDQHFMVSRFNVSLMSLQEGGGLHLGPLLFCVEASLAHTTVHSTLNTSPFFQEELATFFAGELNPVAPKAQRKVSCPSDLFDVPVLQLS